MKLIKTVRIQWLPALMHGASLQKWSSRDANHGWQDVSRECFVRVQFARVSVGNGGLCLNFNKVNSRVKSPGACNYLHARVTRRLPPCEKEGRKEGRKERKEGDLYGNLYGIQGKQPSNLREKYVKYWLHFIITWEPVVLATLSTLVPLALTLLTFSHPLLTSHPPTLNFSFSLGPFLRPSHFLRCSPFQTFSPSPSAGKKTRPHACMLYSYAFTLE